MTEVMIEEIKKLKLTIDVLNRKIGALEKTVNILVNCKPLIYQNYEKLETLNHRLLRLLEQREIEMGMVDYL